MSNFSSIYKKEFKQTLYPYGYNIFKSTFYKIVNDNICFIIRVRKESTPRCPNFKIDLGIDYVPYCWDSKLQEYDLIEYGPSVNDLLRRLVPDKLTEEYFSERYFVKNEETLNNNLNIICNDLESLILPYIHKFTDFEYFYQEYKEILLAMKWIHNIYDNDYIYSLAVKLHKYEDALVYVDSQILRQNNSINRANTEILDFKNGNLDAGALRELKKKPDFINISISYSESFIMNCENEIKKLQIIKEALLGRNFNFLDNYTNEIENRSREYMRQMLNITTPIKSSN